MSMEKPSINAEKIKLLREKLRLLEREVGSPFSDEDSCCGLTLAQCHTLLEVGTRGEVSLVDLAESLGLDASTLSRTIQGLVLIGLVNRVASEKDRRYVVLTLTEQGRKSFDAIENLFNGFFEGVMGLIPEEKRDNVVEAVGLLADAVRRHNEQSGCCAPRRRR
jgi:DNA-binding MarR family transcriptional regulator